MRTNKRHLILLTPKKFVNKGVKSIQKNKIISQYLENTIQKLLGYYYLNL